MNSLRKARKQSMGGQGRIRRFSVKEAATSKQGRRCSKGGRKVGVQTKSSRAGEEGENDGEFMQISRLLRRCQGSAAREKAPGKQSVQAALCPINENSFEHRLASVDPTVGQAIEDTIEQPSSFKEAEGQKASNALVSHDHEESSPTFARNSVSSVVGDTGQFVVWSNAAFCSEAWDLVSYYTGSYTRSENSVSSPTGARHGPIVDIDEDQARINDKAAVNRVTSESHSFISRTCETSCLSVTAVAGSSHPTPSDWSKQEKYSHSSQEIVSSVGSNPPVREKQVLHHPMMGAILAPTFSCEKQLECSLSKRISFSGSLLESNASVDADSKKRKPLVTCLAREPSRQRRWEKMGDASAISKQKQEINRIKDLSQDFRKDSRKSLVDEEAKLRAELEIEIEKDLEQEITMQISLLTQRLSELHTIQAARYKTKEEPYTALRQYKTPISAEKLCGFTGEEEILQSSPKQGKLKTIKEKDAPATFPRAAVKLKGGRTINHQSKVLQNENKLKTMDLNCNAQSSRNIVVEVSPSPARKGVHFSYADSPVTHWKRKAASLSHHSGGNWPSEVKGKFCDGPLPITDAYQGRQGIRTPNGAFEKLKNNCKDGKLNAQIKDTNFKPCHTWTSSGSTKKFDWVKTLRSGVSSSPRVPKAKLPHELSSSCGPSVAVSSILPAGSARVVRSLFVDNGSMSVLRKDRSTGHNSVIPSADNFKDGKRSDHAYNKFLGPRQGKQLPLEGTTAVEQKCRDPEIMQGKKSGRTLAKQVESKKISTAESREFKSNNFSNGRLHEMPRKQCGNNKQPMAVIDPVRKLKVANTKKKIHGDSLDTLAAKSKGFLEGHRHQGEASAVPKLVLSDGLKHEDVKNETAICCAIPLEPENDSHARDEFSNLPSDSSGYLCSEMHIKMKAHLANAKLQFSDCLENEREKLPKINTGRELTTSPRDSGSIKRSAERSIKFHFFCFSDYDLQGSYEGSELSTNADT